MIGPFLFIYITHVVSSLNYKFCLFADEHKLFLASVISKSEHLISYLHLEGYIDILFNTSISWGCFFSSGKYVRMNSCRNFPDTAVLLLFFTGEQPILVVNNLKDLGVRIDFSSQVPSSHERRWHKLFGSFLNGTI